MHTYCAHLHQKSIFQITPFEADPVQQKPQPKNEEIIIYIFQ
jgi:hypothetical protein